MNLDIENFLSNRDVHGRDVHEIMGSTHLGVRLEYVHSGLVLLFLDVTLIFIWNPLPSPSGYVSATRLEVFVADTARVGEQVTVVIRAIDDQGRVDVKRNDLVNVSVGPKASAQLSTSRVALKNGEAALTILGVAPETVTITAAWVSGYSFLDDGEATITFEG